MCREREWSSTQILRRRAEGSGIVQSGEEESKGRAHCSLKGECGELKTSHFSQAVSDGMRGKHNVTES